MNTSEILFGQEVWERETARIAATVPSTGLGYNSEALCRAQIASDVTAAHIVKTIYGHSLRYASGLQNFGIIARFPPGEPSLQQALDYARTWQAADPTRRYVYASY